MKTRILGLLVLMSIFVLVGCTQTTDNRSNDTTGDNTTVTFKELNVELYNFGFRTNDVQINQGDRVRLTVRSSEGTHGFYMPDFGIDLKPIEEGKSMTVEFVADKSGTFNYRCNVPCGEGHMNMTGTLTVR